MNNTNNLALRRFLIRKNAIINFNYDYKIVKKINSKFNSKLNAIKFFRYLETNKIKITFDNLNSTVAKFRASLIKGNNNETI